MFSALTVVQPYTMDEAYKILTEKRNNAVLGGCAFLKLGNRKLHTAVDLSKLNLGEIVVNDGYIEIGAMVTFRDMETNGELLSRFNGVLPRAVSNIIGVQFRNVVTIGASVYSKYGFSDLITALLALDTEVELYKGGRMPLAVFLSQPYEKDILTKIYIKLDNRQASYQDMRNSRSDFPLVNVAVSRLNSEWAVVVGARPYVAAVARQASAELAKGDLSDIHIEHVAAMAVQELGFGTNTRASAVYRQAVAKTMIKRAIREVLQCR